MPCSTMAISATCNQFSASVIHDVWIWLVSRRSKQPLIMAAAVEGPLQRSSAKSNSNSSNLLHVKMLSAAGLDCTPLGLRRDARGSPLRVCQHQRTSDREGGGNLGPIPIFADVPTSFIYMLRKLGPRGEAGFYYVSSFSGTCDQLHTFSTTYNPRPLTSPCSLSHTHSPTHTRAHTGQHCTSPNFETSPLKFSSRTVRTAPDATVTFPEVPRARFATS